jgi:transcription initiation factor TFIID subunit 5
MFWHLGHGHLVAQLNGHQDTIFSLSFSRDGAILASGGNDDRVNLWDAQKLIEEIEVEEVNSVQGPVVKSHNDNTLLGSYRTKSTNILGLHFTRKNLLISSGIIH